jgi:hypothetical protein
MFGKDFDPSKVKIVKVNIKRHTIQWFNYDKVFENGRGNCNSK